MSFDTPIEINDYLKTFIEKLPGQSLSDDIAIEIFESIKTNLYELAQERSNSLTNLSNLIHLLQPSDVWKPYFNNKKLLTLILTHGIQVPQENPTYIIIGSYLKGEIFEDPSNSHYKLFVEILANNFDFIDKLVVRFSFKDPGSIKASMHFLSSLIRILCFEVNYEFAVRVVIVILLLDIPAQFQSLLMKNAESKDIVSEHFILLHEVLNSKKIDPVKYHIHDSLIKKIAAGIHSTESQPQLEQEIAAKYNIPILISVLVLVNNKKSNPFKLACRKQHCLSPASKFPVSKFMFSIAVLLNQSFFSRTNPKYNTVVKNIIYSNDLCLFFLDHSLAYWNESGAIDCQEDFQHIITLIKFGMIVLNDSMNTNIDIMLTLKEISDKLSYKNIQKCQLNFVQANMFLLDMSLYQNMLVESLKYFVIQQTLMELIDGQVCYMKDPSVRLDSTIFISLSPQRNNLLYNPVSPNMVSKPLVNTKNCKSISVLSIKKVITINHDKFEDGSGYIKISGKLVATEVMLLDKHNQTIFSFFTKAEKLAELWLDGLNLLIDNFRFSKVSKSTKQRMELLFEIRRNLQFSSSSEDKLVFDLDFLLVKLVENDLVKKKFNQLLLRKDNGKLIDIEEGEEENLFEYTFDELQTAAKDFYY